MLKLIFFLRRTHDLDRASFQRYWLDHHGPLFRSTAVAQRYVVRYEQQHTIDAAEATADFDGVGVQWYRSAEDTEALFSDAEYLAVVRPDEERFIDLTRTTWLLTRETDVLIPIADSSYSPRPHTYMPICSAALGTLPDARVWRSFFARRLGLNRSRGHGLLCG